MSRKLEILKSSLAKKEARFDQKLQEHFDSVRAANGQPMNDKGIAGRKVMTSWDRQNDVLRRQQTDIEKTRRAIEKEEAKIKACQGQVLPEAMLTRLESGDLIQWRRHPSVFFVPGVEKARIVWREETKTLVHRYLSDVPSDQYQKFRDAFNSLRADIAKSGGEK